MAFDADNAIILSYHNTCIRKSDLLLLMPILDKSMQSRKIDRWLNDVIVSFAFEYFEFNTFFEYADSMAFLNPSVAQLLKLTLMSEEEINGITFLLNPLDLQHKSIIFVPINDHDSFHDSGGTHWSLAVFCIEKPISLKPETSTQSLNDTVYCNATSVLSIRVYHYDSHLGSTNFRQAHCLAQKMVPFLVGPMNIHNNSQLTNSVLREPSPLKKPEVVSGGTRTSSRLFYKSLLQRQRHDSNSSPTNSSSLYDPEAEDSTNSSSPKHSYKIPLCLASGRSIDITLTVQEVKRCPQQINGFDCGMYCIALAETVGRAYVSHAQTMHSLGQDEGVKPFIPPYAEPGQANNTNSDASDSITPAYIARQRTQLYELILRLAGDENDKDKTEHS